MNEYLLIFMGLITGLIDSIVGGGGLISLPTLSIALSPGTAAIATNKIVGAAGALTALIVYARKGHLQWKRGLLFCAICGFGAFFGSLVAPYISQEVFKYLLLTVCPIILYIVWNKDRFIQTPDTNIKVNPLLFFLVAFGSGFYDGVFGPGGGMFMFLGLFLVVGFSLLPAIAISKMANVFSATTALVSFSFSGHVHWRHGLIMMSGMLVGSFLGASYATKNIDKIVRPLLMGVVVLLMVKIIWF